MKCRNESGIAGASLVQDGLKKYVTKAECPEALQVLLLGRRTQNRVKGHKSGGGRLISPQQGTVHLAPETQNPEGASPHPNMTKLLTKKPNKTPIFVPKFLIGV